MMKISATLITYNEERQIARAIESLRCADEIVVVDSGSVDRTVEIAQKLGARVVEHPFKSYAGQKNFAAGESANDWILSLDADEVLDDDAARAIARIAFDDPARCWSLTRRTFIGRREVRHGPWGGERVLRLFNRTTAAFTSQAVHEEVRGARPPHPLPGSILHYSFDDTAAVLLRSIRYARLKAGVMRGKGQRTSGWTMPWRGAVAFVKAYLLQGGWRDGPDGFVIALSRVIDSTLPRAMLLLGEDDGVDA